MVAGRSRFAHDLPEIRNDRWGLTVPYFRALIATKNASFCGDFRRSGAEMGMAPEMRHPYPRLETIRGPPRLALSWPRFPHDLPDITDRTLGITDALFPDHNRGKEGIVLWRFYAGWDRGGNGSEMSHPYP